MRFCQKGVYGGVETSPEVTITGIAAERPVAWSLGPTGTQVNLISKHL